MENKNGQGIFYGVIGVATLVVAIIGATFAYFSATAESNNVITGTAAAAGLEVTVTKVSTDATGGLIPLDESLLDNAIKGDTATQNKMCVDKNGNTVCQMYKIAVQSKSTSTVNLTGTLALSFTGGENTYDALKWVNFNSTGLTTDTQPTGYTDQTKNAYSATPTPITTAEPYSAGVTKYYYVLVYINNVNQPQETTNKGTYTGVVRFTSSDGTGVQATFSA